MSSRPKPTYFELYERIDFRRKEFFRQRLVVNRLEHAEFGGDTVILVASFTQEQFKIVQIHQINLFQPYIGVAELTDQKITVLTFEAGVFTERFETGDLKFETIRNGAFNPSALRFEQGFQRNGNLKFPISVFSVRTLEEQLRFVAVK